jgi:hypothetical protein
VNLIRLREAIASVAFSHPPECTCVVCRADSGDREACAEVATILERLVEDAERNA